MIRWSKFDTFVLFVGLAVVYGAIAAAVLGVVYLIGRGAWSLFT